MREIAIDADAPTFLPLDLELVKLDLRITHDELDDVLVSQHIPDALAWAENSTRRAIVQRTHRWIIDEFPYGDDQTLYLPRGRVTAVASVAYSSGGAITTLRGPTSGSPIGTDYQEDLRGHRGRLMPLRGETWPSVDCDVLAPVVVTFTAGWALADMPADLRRALTICVAQALELSGVSPEKELDLELREKIISAYRIVVP